MVKDCSVGLCPGAPEILSFDLFSSFDCWTVRTNIYWTGTGAGTGVFKPLSVAAGTWVQIPEIAHPCCSVSCIEFTSRSSHLAGRKGFINYTVLNRGLRWIRCVRPPTTNKWSIGNGIPLSATIMCLASGSKTRVHLPGRLCTNTKPKKDWIADTIGRSMWKLD